MSERTYTVSEIDSLRRACKIRWLFGTTNPGDRAVSKSYRTADMDRGVEELVRTYMLAGIVADDIYQADRPILTQSEPESPGGSPPLHSKEMNDG